MQVRLLLMTSQEDYACLNELINQIDLCTYVIDWAAKAEWSAAIAHQQYDICLVSQSFLAAVAPHSVPLIVLADDLHSGRAALEAGAVDYLIKNQLDVATVERSLRLTFALARTHAKLGQRSGERLTERALQQVSPFEQQIQIAKQYLETLQQSVTHSAPPKELLSEAIAQLAVALEELHVASEELSAQNQELVVTRQAVEQERQHYQELFEFAPDGYIVTDERGIIQEANGVTASLLNVPKQNLVGKPLVVFVAKADRKIFHAQLSQCHQYKQELTMQPRGKPFPAAIAVSAIDNSQGILRRRWLIRDITERQQTQALKHQKELLQAIFDRIPIMIALFDSQGQVQLLNQELERVLGWSLSEKQDVLTACYPNPEYRQTVLDHMLTATSQWQDLKTRVRDGRMIDTSWANVWLADGSCIGIGQDITPRKQAEKQLQYRLSLETALAEISKELATQEAALDWVLELLGVAVKASHVFLKQFKANGSKAKITHEWHDSQTQPDFKHLDAEISVSPWWKAQLEDRELVISDIETLPAAAQTEKQALKALEINSLLAVPIYTHTGQLWGQIGFASCGENDKQWSDEDVRLLRVVGEILYSYHFRIRTQEKLRASKALYAGIFEHAAEVMFLLRVVPNGFVYEAVNPAFEKATNKSSAQVVGKTIAEVLPPQAAPWCQKSFRACLTTGEPIDLEATINFFAGDKPYGHSSAYRTWHTKLVPIRDATGQVVKILGSARDVTEAKQAVAEQLRLTLHQRLLASLTLKIRQSWQIEEILQTAVLEIQSILQAERVVFFRQLTGRLGKVIHEAVSPGFPAMQDEIIVDKYCHEAVREKYSDGSVFAYADVSAANFAPCYLEFLEQYHIRANLIVPIILHREAELESPPQPSVANPNQIKVWGLLCVQQCSQPREWTADEIELLKQLGIQISVAIEQAQLREQESQQRQQLAHSNAELEQFAYIASHDLQEPLQTIANYAKLLQRRYRNQLDAKADKYIYYMVDGAQRMQTQIKDLLDYSRVGNQQKIFEPTDFHWVLQQASFNLRASIARNQATVTATKLPTLSADPAQMVQLFQNLISNAIKYRGTAPPVIQIEAQRQQQGWLFSISDNGIGIDPKYSDRIFQIFQRLHTQEEYPGTGIGLAICRKIVERHGGQIWVESQLGQGSILYFTLSTHLI